MGYFIHCDLKIYCAHFIFMKDITCNHATLNVWRSPEVGDGVAQVCLPN